MDVRIRLTADIESAANDVGEKYYNSPISKKSNTIVETIKKRT